MVEKKRGEVIRIFCDTQGQGIVHSRSWINGHCPAGSQYPLQLKLCIVWYGLVNFNKNMGLGQTPPLV